jgi:hypothetical protein
MTHARDFPWTDEHVRILGRMCADGCSPSVIAAKFGITRNAVIGKAARAGLKFNHPKNKVAAPQPKPKPKPPPAPLPAPEHEDAPEWTDAQIAEADLREGGKLIRRGQPAKRLQSTPCTIVELTQDTCRWPLWRDDGSGERLYCGDLALWESAYCAYHSDKAYGRKPVAEEKPAC